MAHAVCFVAHVGDRNNSPVRTVIVPSRAQRCERERELCLNLPSCINLTRKIELGIDIRSKSSLTHGYKGFVEAANVIRRGGDAPTTWTVSVANGMPAFSGVSVSGNHSTIVRSLHYMYRPPVRVSLLSIAIVSPPCTSPCHAFRVNGHSILHQHTTGNVDAWSSERSVYLKSMVDYRYTIQIPMPAP